MGLAAESEHGDRLAGWELTLARRDEITVRSLELVRASEIRITDMAEKGVLKRSDAHAVLRLNFGTLHIGNSR